MYCIYIYINVSTEVGQKTIIVQKACCFCFMCMVYGEFPGPFFCILTLTLSTISLIWHKSGLKFLLSDCFEIAVVSPPLPPPPPPPPPPPSPPRPYLQLVSRRAVRVYDASVAIMLNDCTVPVSQSSGARRTL